MGCISSKEKEFLIYKNNFQTCKICDKTLHHKNMNKILKPQLRGNYYCEKCFYRSKRFYNEYI